MKFKDKYYDDFNAVPLIQRANGKSLKKSGWTTAKVPGSSVALYEGHRNISNPMSGYVKSCPKMKPSYSEMYEWLDGGGQDLD